MSGEICDFEEFDDFSVNYFEGEMDLTQIKHLRNLIAFLEVQKCLFDHCPEPEVKELKRNRKLIQDDEVA